MKIKFGLVLLASIFSLLTWAAWIPKDAHAAYDNNNIMSDAVFDDTNTMTVDQIQTFLNGFPSSCLANYQAPYPIDYSNYGGNVSAATVIRRVADLWQMNPRVILVTLEKEEGLVSGGSGCADWRYNSAVGMGCPDGGQCPAPPYAGFSKQVTKGMWQLQFSKFRSYGDLSWGDNGSVYYAGFMTAGVRSRMSGQTAVSYDGYATIDGTSVYMSNGATAALYTYTPHFSGNQHFVSIFNSWFGSTQVSDLVRTVDNGTIYLISGNTKYPIADINTFNALYPLGGVSYVGQSYIDSKTTSQTLGRAIAAPDGTVYFFDAGIKLPFTTCNQVADYGYTCAQLPQLTAYQVSALYNGPAMTNVFATTSGKRFYVTSGAKKEVYDDQSLSQSGIGSTANTLNEPAINNLPYSSPVVRANTFINNRAGGLYAYQSSTLNQVDPTAISGTSLSAFTNSPKLDPQSLSTLTSGGMIGALLKVSGGNYYIVTSQGKVTITDPSQWKDSFTTVSQQIVDQIPSAQTVGVPYFIKTASSGTVYYLSSQTKRPVTTMAAIFSLANTTNPTIVTVPDTYATSLSTGNYLLKPGSLVKAPNDGTVYMIDGLGAKVTLTTFDPAFHLGFDLNVATIDQRVLDGYSTASQTTLSNIVTCQGSQYTAIDGTLYKQTTTFGTPTALDSLTCRNMPTAQNQPSFLLGPDGTIYKITNGLKQAIRSYSTYTSLGGSSSNTLWASNPVLNGYQTGTAL